MLKHPFQSPGEQLIEVGDEPIRQTPPDAPGPLAKVLTVTAVTGGQRITYREQTSTSRTNATARDADNPVVGEAMVPSAFGTAAVNDIVMTFPLPGRDEMLAVPVTTKTISYVEDCSFDANTCRFNKIIRTITIRALGLSIQGL